MKIKTSYFCFFKDSFNKRAVTPTFDLHEVNVSTFALFEYERGSLEAEWVFEKTNMISHFLFIKFLLKCYPLGGKEGANHPPKGPQTRSARAGPINYDVNDDNDDDDDDDDDDDAVDLHHLGS